eukprot:SAG31_NODE_3635_length_4035_cov_11.591463_2_plen_169_part_00
MGTSVQAWRASRSLTRAADAEERLRERALRGRRKLRDRAAEAQDCQRELEQRAVVVANEIAEVRMDETRAQATADAVFERARKVLSERQAAITAAISARFATEVEPLQADLRVVSTIPTASTSLQHQRAGFTSSSSYRMTTNCGILCAGGNGTGRFGGGQRTGIGNTG